MEPRELEKRVKISLALVALVFLALFSRLFDLQVVHGQRYDDLSSNNRLRILPISAPRGEIRDRDGQVLAETRPAFAVSLMHMGVTDLDRTIGSLSGILGMTPEEIRKRIEAQRDRLYEPILLKSDIPPEMHTMLEERRLDLPGVVVEVRPIRYYPQGKLAAHVLGYLGEIDQASLLALEAKGYHAGDIVGKSGIEATFDEYLRGSDGGRQVEVDSRGRPKRVMGRIEPQPGSTVLLTLDAGLQRVAEDALRKSMESLRTNKYDPYPNARAGAVVALDPSTGEILALASEPAYDPNLFASRISAADWQALQGDPLQPMLDRAVSGLYQPGSAFKMVTAIAGLETGHTTGREVFPPCTGLYHMTARDVKRCWALKYGGHGALTLVNAIGQSCNSVFYELGRRVGIDDMARYARELGFGQLTGLEDIAGEKGGLVPTTEWKRRAFPRDPQWWLSESLDAAIGQGFHQYTPIQVANYVAALANGGVRYRPFLVRQVLDAGGSAVYTGAPSIAGRAAIRPATLDIVRAGMIAVTSPGGTAAAAFSNFPFKVAGKTGTAEFTGKDSHSWFVCYAPADKPRIAIAILIEEGGSGSLAAAPVARTMLEEFFDLPPAPAGD
jgi:penicillin-binding protein 2